ncbi:peroxidase family protein [Parahaliea aestuarii]|uniref:Oxygenase n=1 Tax=Parahaliea aestuarii TaxID=1852021 RepID=A0A5C8ZSY2_9GAMM|nr:peroxidase family protein [Parahaliea aestuarii]TXS90421.1 oxygenase [Parahaliea aestuarii]
MRVIVPRCLVPVVLAGALSACSESQDSDKTGEQAKSDTSACVSLLRAGFRDFPDDRSRRFLGKVGEDAARCRGGQRAMDYRHTPWVDWANYWAAGDMTSREDPDGPLTLIGEHIKPDGRGVDGALMDLEYQRIELIKFNLFDNDTYETYVKGRGTDDDRVSGPNVKVWPEMRLTPSDPAFAAVGGEGEQRCSGELVRYRTLTGICNDVFNPRIGATGTPFARNVSFDATFPRLQLNELAVNRHRDEEHGLRIGLLKPDPQRISRELFTRQQSSPGDCDLGRGSACDYLPAPFFNVLAAYWIQFMTHDWFSHTREGRNRPGLEAVGCDDPEATGCRPGDRAERIITAATGPAPTFEHGGASYQKRAHTTTPNLVTAWWDASQIYGFDDVSARRVLRDPDDPAKLLQPEGYLPLFSSCLPDCPMQSQWSGQEVAAFPANWSIGMSFYHNLFVREHNHFVDAFRNQQRERPDLDSGLRNPARPNDVIRYAQVSDEEIFQAARLVVAAEIAKIHTIEWTTQLLYDEPLFLAMNSNWFGLFNVGEANPVSRVLDRILDRQRNLPSKVSAKAADKLGREGGGDKDNAIYSVFASGAGIFGLNNRMGRDWDITDPADLNRGVNHFGAPFNFPEEFTTVYRLHPLLPDIIEMRDTEQPNRIGGSVPVVATVRGAASGLMREHGLADWALSMGRQRLGLLHLQNHPLFLQNLEMPHLESPSGQLDIVALDVLRDRERGVPRFNEFRRQIGLKSLSGFDDFIDQRLAPDDPARKQQQAVIDKLRALYGTHTCDASKIISTAQRDDEGQFINDCLGHPDGSVVDNIEDVDTVVGWLAEYTRPHGFAISETQFHIFILNASRRLFSDRFFTSSFRPEFYSQLGYDWVLYNGSLEGCPYPPEDREGRGKNCYEPEQSNGHHTLVSPLKRLLLRNVPELASELRHVVNVFDPWARDRGEYYDLSWKPRQDAIDDPAFGGAGQP